MQYIARQYRANLPQSGTQQVFDKLRTEYADYLKTCNEDTLRYILALCIRVRHGRRMRWVYTKQAVDRLLENNVMSIKENSFKRLHLTLEKWLRDIPFARGSLTVYDTALDIGDLLAVPLAPKEDVYLNAGAWDGAIALLGKENVKPVMPISVWQQAGLFPSFESMYIEDILCICKSIFKKLSLEHSATKEDVDDCIMRSCIVRFPSKEYVLMRMNEYN